MGLVWDRRYFHEMINLSQGIADLTTLLKPQLTIIDAMTVMVNIRQVQGIFLFWIVKRGGVALSSSSGPTGIK